MPTYTGSCHCEKVAFEVEGNIEGALSCNCSICSRKGALLWFVPRSSFKLKTAESAASTDEFNKHRIKHRFCHVPATCSTIPMGRMASRPSMTTTAHACSGFP